MRPDKHNKKIDPTSRTQSDKSIISSDQKKDLKENFRVETLKKFLKEKLGKKVM